MAKIYIDRVVKVKWKAPEGMYFPISTTIACRISKNVDIGDDPSRISREIYPDQNQFTATWKRGGVEEGEKWAAKAYIYPTIGWKNNAEFKLYFGGETVRDIPADKKEVVIDLGEPELISTAEESDKF